MTPLFLRERSAATWKLVAAQFGVITKAQLLELGYTLEAIRHRVRIGRLHVVHRCVYAVGRPELTIQGRWMAAVLASRDGARLSGQSMAEHLGFRPLLGGSIEIVVPARCSRRVNGLTVHRSDIPEAHQVEHLGIPGVSVVVSMIQIAPRLSLGELERAINQADGQDLIDTEMLRSELDAFAGQKGVVPLREALDRRTYHRTAAQQNRDRKRDQTHLAAGDTPLRFTHGQVRYEPGYVERTLRAVVARIRRSQQLKL